MLHSDSIDALAPALVAAQAAIGPAEKDGINPHFKTRYASLGAVMAAVRPALAANGLAVSQIVTRDGDQLALETLLVHTSGQFIGGVYPLRPTKADPQGEGSALTYARRYALASLLGVVADDDDDGNAASRGNDRRPRPAVVAPGGARIAPERRNAPQATGRASFCQRVPSRSEVAVSVSTERYSEPPATLPEVSTPRAPQNVSDADSDFDRLPSASKAPAQAAALAHGSNGNGHRPTRPTWSSPDDAQAWAMKQTDAAGVVIFHAKPHCANAYNKLRTAYAAEAEHPTPAEFFDRWHADVQRRLDEANAKLDAELDALAAAEETPAF